MRGHHPPSRCRDKGQYHTPRASTSNANNFYDNVSKYPTIDNYFSIIHDKTREDIIAAFPWENWLACFAEAVGEELRQKPWCHLTHIPGMEVHIRGNELLKPYE